MVILEEMMLDGNKGMAFFCPGCRNYHAFIIEQHSGGPLWTWNGSMDKPTFSPSLLVSGSDSSRRCHCYVNNGQIQYLSDCWHKLAGQTVDMVSVE